MIDEQKYERLQISEMFSRCGIYDIFSNCKTLDQAIESLKNCKKTIANVPDKYQKYKIIDVDSVIKYDYGSYFVANFVVYEESDWEYSRRVIALKKQEERQKKADKLAESKEYKEYQKLKKKFSKIEVKEKHNG